MPLELKSSRDDRQEMLAATPCDLKRRSQENRRRRFKQKAAAKLRTSLSDQIDRGDAKAG